MIQYSGSREYEFHELQELVAKIRAIVYVRVSTADQVDNYSLSSQIELCVEHAQKKFGINDEEIIAIIEPGLSGDDPERPGLNHALWLIEQGVGGRIIFLHPNRLSRHIGIQNNVADRIWKAGADIEFVELELDKDNPESILSFNIQGSIAQYQKAKILADTKRGRMRMVKNGKIPGLKRVYGYTYDKELDILVENPDEKQVYLMMVDWYLNGKEGREMNCTAIAEELSLLGIPAPNADYWYQATVSRILRSENFTGKFYYGKTKMDKVDGKKKQVPLPREQWRLIQIPAYIDEMTYQIIQQKLDQNEKRGRGRKTSVYLLKGLVRCGRCGYAAGAAPVKKLQSGIRYYYYACTAKHRKGFEVGTGAVRTKCRGRNWRQDVIDGYVWEFIVERLKAPEKVIAEVVKQQSDYKKTEEMQRKKEQLDKRLKDKQAERKNIMLLFTRGTIKSADELDDMLKPVDEQISKIEKDLKVYEEYLRMAATTFNELEMLKKSIQEIHEVIKYDDLTFEAKQDLIQRFVDQVVLYDDAIEVVTKWLPNPPPPLGGVKPNSARNQGDQGHLRLVHRGSNESEKALKFNRPSRRWRITRTILSSSSPATTTKWKRSCGPTPVCRRVSRSC